MGFFNAEVCETLKGKDYRAVDVLFLMVFSSISSVTEYTSFPNKTNVHAIYSTMKSRVPPSS